MPPVAPEEQHFPVASTGVEDLDRALHGLYWGDNVIFQPDRAETAAPFYAAIAALSAPYDQAAYVSLSLPAEIVERDYPSLSLIDARPGTPLAEAGALLNAIRRRCKPQSRSLLLFDPLDDMAARWGSDMARRFFHSSCAAAPREPILRQSDMMSSGMTKGGYSQPSRSRAPLISSAPSGLPWAAAVPALVGAPNAMIVRQAIRLGRSLAWARSIAAAIWLWSSPSIRSAFQPCD